MPGAVKSQADVVGLPSTLYSEVYVGRRSGMNAGLCRQVLLPTTKRYFDNKADRSLAN